MDDTSQPSQPSASTFFSTLSPPEVFWRDRQQGYMLRPRYHPGWRPSWSESGLLNSFLSVEDSFTLPLRGGHFIDARRISDGKLVYLKQIYRGSEELGFLEFLSSEKIRADPRNHCVPLLDILTDAGNENVVFIAMPFLRPFEIPEFQTVDGLLHFGDQIFECLTFLHEHGIAHRDCAAQNIMFDPAPLFPDGFHPVFAHYLPDLSGAAYPIPRSGVDIKYYFIDFGISVYVRPDTYTKLAEGDAGLDREPPELSLPDPYDPFKLDIFILGNLFHRRFVDVYSNLDFLDGLTEKMTRPDPASRPDADVVFQDWIELRSRVSIVSRNWRLKQKSDPLPEQIASDVYGLVKAGLSGTRWRRFL